MPETLPPSKIDYLQLHAGQLPVRGVAEAGQLFLGQSWIHVFSAGRLGSAIGSVLMKSGLDVSQNDPQSIEKEQLGPGLALRRRHLKWNKALALADTYEGYEGAGFVGIPAANESDEVDEFISRAAVAVCASNRPSAHITAMRKARRHSKAHFAVGVADGRHHLAAGFRWSLPEHPEHFACTACGYHPEMDRQIECGEGLLMSVIEAAAGLTANLVIQYLLRLPGSEFLFENNNMLVNLGGYEFEKFTMSRDEGCVVCGPSASTCSAGARAGDRQCRGV